MNNQNPAQLTKEQIALLNSKYSTTTTYCKRSGVKLIIGTEFQNSFLKGRLLAHEHYVFTLTTSQLLRLASTHLHKGNPTEKALLTNAILHKVGVVSTTAKGANSPLFLDDITTTRIRKAVNALIKAWSHYESNGIELPQLPVFIVNETNCDSYVALANTLKMSLAVLEEHSFKVQLTTRSKDKEFERDYNSLLNKEKSFQAILDNYSASNQPKKFTRHLGKWAVQQLTIQCPDIEVDKLASINHYIQSDSNRLSDDVLKSYIKLLEEELPLDDEHYDTSHLVIRHLKSKLELINKELADYSFIILEQEESLVGATNNTTKGGIVGYKTKTKVVSSSMAIKVKPSERIQVGNTGAKLAGAGSALSRLMAKFKTNNTVEGI